MGLPTPCRTPASMAGRRLRLCARGAEQQDRAPGQGKQAGRGPRSLPAQDMNHGAPAPWLPRIHCSQGKLGTAGLREQLLTSYFPPQGMGVGQIKDNSLPKAVPLKNLQAVSSETSHMEVPTGLCVCLRLAAESGKAPVRSHPTMCAVCC